MKKKRMALIGFALFFLALLVGEAYCLLRGDLISILGVGVVLLIIAYLLLDAILDYIKGEPEAEMLPGMDWEYGQMEKILSGQTEAEEEKEETEAEQESEAERLQKAIYVLQKKSFDALQKEMQAARAQENTAISELKEELTTLIKAEIKYERENTNQIINENRKQIERLTKNLQDVKPQEVSQPTISVDYQETLDRLAQQVGQIVELLQERPAVSVAPQQELEPEPEAEEMLIMPEFEEEFIMPEFEEELMEEPTLEDYLSEIDLSLGEEPQAEEEPELEDLLTEIGLGLDLTEPVVEDVMPEVLLEQEEELTEEDLSELIAGLLGEAAPEELSIPEPVTEPEPTPVAPAAPADPNKPLSPEEIAALFASMGQ